MTAFEHTTVDSPVGPLSLVRSGTALAGLYMAEQRHAPPTHVRGTRVDSGWEAVTEQLDAYWQGSLRAFDLPLLLLGTPFQRRVWTALQAVAYGETVSYGQLAVRIGAPGAARAVGLANGRNRVGIVVPCHRIIGSTGRLVGYGGGLDRKQQLLAHERAHVQEPASTPWRGL